MQINHQTMKVKTSKYQALGSNIVLKIAKSSSWEFQGLTYYNIKETKEPSKGMDIQVVWCHNQIIRIKTRSKLRLIWMEARG